MPKFKVTCTVHTYAVVEADTDAQAEEMAREGEVDMLVHSEEWNVFEEVRDDD